MLRKLGRHLAVLNLLISGAILLAMALIVLGIAEKNMTAKYERDLQSFSTSVVSAIAGGGAENQNALLIQIPDSYLVHYQGSESGPSMVIRAASGTAAEMAAIMDAVVPSLEAGSDAKKSELLFSDIQTIGFVSVQEKLEEPSWEWQDAGASEAPALHRISFHITQNAQLHSNIQGEAYRVSTSRLQLGEEESLLVVAQNRGEELRERDQLRGLFAIMVCVGLAAIMGASLYLSRRSIQPIEKSIRQQQEFVAAASHELRTPVAAIHANAEVLMDASLSRQYARHLESICVESKRMTRLVSDLMDLARADAGELSMESALVDAWEMARQATQLIAPLAKEKGLSLESSGHTALMEGDGERLRQILLILLDNALRYTPEGGSISLEAGAEGHHVYFRVADTGPGIPEEDKSRIFDRFYRMEKARSRKDGNAGLGLSIARQLAEQMRGSLSVQDREGGGSVFEARFPQAKAAKRTV